MNTYFKLMPIFLTVLYFTTCELLAAPRNGELYEFHQPDGSIVQVKLYGDDYYLRAESLDGYTLIHDEKTGWICYAQLNQTKDQLVSTGIHYEGSTSLSTFERTSTSDLLKHLDLPLSVIEKQRKQTEDDLGGHQHFGNSFFHDLKPTQHGTNTNRVIGKYKAISILVDFSDAPAVWDKSTIEQMMNGENFTVNGNYSSVKKYFKDVSGGLVEYDNVVVGYYRAPKTFAEYDNMSYAAGAREILQFVLSKIDEEGFDFSSLSKKNGNIQAINLMYTGSPRAWAKGMWYHKGTYTGFSADGVGTRDYNTSPVNDNLSIGTIIHENGHMLCGWPDLYKYSSSTGTSGIGNFCIMSGYGSTKNPIPPNPYFRWLAGWTQTTNISNYNGTIEDGVNDKTIYKYDHPSNTNEFFILEGVRKTGRGKFYPDEGLAIWHIDRTGNNQTWDHEVWLEHANNTRDGHTGACWHQGGNVTFNDSSSPNARWLDGSPSNLAISEVGGIGNTMAFKAVGNGAQCTNNDVTAIQFAVDSISIFRDQVITLNAEAYNECGEIVNTAISWSNNAPEGVFSSNDFGRFVITASVGNIEKQVVIHVIEDPENCSDPSVVELQLSPDISNLFLGEQVQFIVKAFNKCGGEESIEPIWASNVEGGLFRANQLGEHIISVTFNDITIEKEITVLPENATLISNSEIDNLSMMNTEWYAHDDGVNGGSSVYPNGSFTMTSEGANNTAYSSKITYSLNQGSLPYNPFVAFGFNLNEEDTPFNLNGSTGISFYHKGDGLHLQTLLSTVSDYAHYQTYIPSHANWTKVTLNWSSFDQPNWGSSVNWDLSKVVGFKWQKNGNTGDQGEIYIDEVKIEGLIFETPLQICESNGLSHLALILPKDEIKIGEKVSLEAIGYDSCNRVIPITPIWSQNSLDGEFTGFQAGAFTISVSTFDEQTEETFIVEKIINVVENISPFISITSPSTGIFENNDFTITASAEDSDGEIEKVEFYVNNNYLGSDSSSPYTYDWQPENGTFQIFAVAEDNEGATTVSEIRTVTVNVEEVASCPIWDANTQYQNGDVVEYSGVNYTAISDWPNVGESPKYNVDNNWGWAWQEGGSCENAIQASPQIITEIDNNEVFLQIYPNPSDGIFNIISSFEYDKVEIYNLQGNKINNSSHNQIDLSNHGKGIYLIKIETEVGVIIRQVIKK